MGRTNVKRNGNCGTRTKELICRYYIQLRDEFCNGDKKLFLSMDRDDMFHNAITILLQDSDFQKLNTDEDIIKLIKKKINNQITEITKDAQQNKVINRNINADNL